MDGELVSGTYPLDLQLFLTAVVAGTWWALYRPLLTGAHYRWWAWGWTVFFLFLVGVRLSFAGIPFAPTATGLFSAPAGLVQVTCFALGAEALRRGEEVDSTASRRWLGLAVAVGLVVGMGLLPVQDDVTRTTVRTLARSPGMALALAYCGWLFLDRRREEGGAGVWLTAGGFLLYALDQTVYTLGAVSQAVALLADTAARGFGIEVVVSSYFLAADMAWEAAIGVGAIVLLVENKNRLYRTSRKNERQFQAVFRGSLDGILVADRDGRVRAANPAALELLGFEEEAGITGMLLRDLQSPEAGASLPDPEWIRERGGVTIETTVRTRDGGEVPVELALSTYRLEDLTHLQAIVRDISARKALMDELEHRATHRPLTDLPNRQYVREEIDRALAMHRRGAPPPGLLFLDLDGFKAVNDAHGHAVGDELLVAVGERLEASVRDTELVGHPGGDEFVVLIQACPDAETLRRVGTRIVRVLSKPFDRIRPGLQLSASVGGALGREGDTSDDLVRRADEAMYQAKSGSGGPLAVAGEAAPES